ncbi:hypothetical protein C1O66_20535 [Paucibacter aquatile]|uniref:Uncharacterized protein n=1 Tax=Kinneretia aquatilis TaxID=2070761 RepID=A0A2N8KRR0_9BURK|nr:MULTISPECIES: hypothetical protein [Roseateles]PND36120.1 hypothetical protein C1O66_20535 [Paucibacter aquatile]
MELTVEGVAAVSLFLANVVVIIVVIATYWRMTRYEESNHIHIVNALRETRDAGREMKIAAHELMRVAEGRGGAANSNFGGAQAPDMHLLSELPEMVRTLINSYGMDTAADRAQREADREPWPAHAHEMNAEQMERLKRSHRNEVDRLLAQRQRVQVELGRTRERLEESLRQISSLRARTGGGGGNASGADSAELASTRQRLEQLRGQVQQAQERASGFELRAERAERTAARLQRELEDLALGGSAEASAASSGSEAPPNAAAIKALEREAQAQREQLATAERTIQKLRHDLEVLSADPPAHDEPVDEAVLETKAKLEKEIEKLKGRIEELEDSLKRNLVEKGFIEQHYLEVTAKERNPGQAMVQALEEAETAAVSPAPATEAPAETAPADPAAPR